MSSTPSSQELQSETTPLSTTEAVKKERSFRELKEIIGNKRPRLMNLWILIFSGGLAASVLYYLKESDEPERKVYRVVQMLQNPDLETRKLGLQTLEECFFEEKRLLTTTTDIPLPKIDLVKKGVVEALYQAIQRGDDEIKGKAIFWLGRLATEEKGRKKINDMSLDPILNSMKDTPGNSWTWLSISGLLMELVKYADTFDLVSSPKVMKTLSQLYTSTDPIANLVSINFYNILLKSEKGRNLIGSSLSEPQKKELEKFSSPMIASAIKGAIQEITPQERIPHNSPLSIENSGVVLWRGFSYGILASIYGRIRWWLHARKFNLTGKEIRKFVRKKNKTGRYVFSLLLMDLIAQAFMVWPKEGLKIPYYEQPVKLPDIGLPLSTAIPIGEAGLVTLLSLLAIRSQRYVVLPMLVAALESHWDYVSNITRPYVAATGIDFSFPKVWDFKEIFSSKPDDKK